MLCLNRVVVLGEARIGNSFESGAGQDVSSAWPIRLFPSVLWLARLAFWEKRKQQRNVVTMHSLKVRSSNCVVSLIGFVDSSIVYSGAFCCADTRWWVTKRHEGLVDSPFLMGIIVSRSMRTIIGLWVHLLKWLIISRRWCTLPDFGGGGGLNDSPTVGEASERFNNPPLLYWGTELKFEAPTWFHRDGFSLEWFRMGWGGQSSKDAMVICHNLSRIQSIQSQLSIMRVFSWPHPKEWVPLAVRVPFPFRGPQPFLGSAAL